MKAKNLFNIDIFIFFSVLILMIVGVLFIYSSSMNAMGEPLYSNPWSSEWAKQIVWVVFGILLMLGFSIFDFKKFQDYSLVIFLGSIFLLLLVLFFGSKVNNARSWLGIWELGIQPSELAKIALIIFLSRFYTENLTRIHKFSVFLTGIGITLIPTFLTILQPDLGTTLTYFAIYFAVSFMAGIKLRYLVFLLLSGFFMVFFTIYPYFEERIVGRISLLGEFLMNFEAVLYLSLGFLLLSVLSFWGFAVTKQKSFYWTMYIMAILFLSLLASDLAHNSLQSYQVDRLIIFLDPYIDEQGAGWNIIQSLNAVGSGGFSGKGFLLGTQSHGNYVPEQSTDFIYSILAEEWGFLGGLTIFGLYLMIFLRGVHIMQVTKEPFGALLSMGILGLLFFHFMVNIGMAIGLLPITGIPLFFISYGGSSLMAISVGIGIIMNIHTHRYMN